MASGTSEGLTSGDGSDSLFDGPDSRLADASESDDDLALGAEPDRVGERSGGPEQPVDRGSLQQRLVRAGAFDLLADVLALVALAVLISGGSHVAVAVLAVVALAVPLLLNARARERLPMGLGPTGSAIFSRAVLALVAVSLLSRDDDPLLLAGGLVLAILVVLERTADRISRGAIAYAANLPGVSVRNQARPSRVGVSAVRPTTSS